MRGYELNERKKKSMIWFWFGTGVVTGAIGYFLFDFSTASQAELEASLSALLQYGRQFFN